MSHDSSDSLIQAGAVQAAVEAGGARHVGGREGGDALGLGGGDDSGGLVGSVARQLHAVTRNPRCEVKGGQAAILQSLGGIRTSWKWQ